MREYGIVEKKKMRKKVNFDVMNKTDYFITDYYDRMVIQRIALLEDADNGMWSFPDS